MVFVPGRQCSKKGLSGQSLGLKETEGFLGAPPGFSLKGILGLFVGLQEVLGGSGG